MFKLSFLLINPSRIATRKAYFNQRLFSFHHHLCNNCKNTVYLGLGSNLGNKIQNINHAIDRLSSPISLSGAGATLVDSSFLYSSEPMYLTEQPEFLNASCKISTPLSPLELLKVIKQIEADQGRKLENVQRNSPRPIDIDILLFNDQIIDHNILSIPHASMLERLFVLEPLNDIASEHIHPRTSLPISSLLADLKACSSSSSEKPPVKRTHLISAPNRPTLDLSTRTHLMSIINCTPDSFHDGGQSFSLSDGIKNSLAHLSAGADILDIGGMSTRPGAEDVGVEEEINRTVPLIRALREEHEVKCHISIDTFRAATARAAIEAGASIVNDVSGGDGDEEMYETVARLGVPYMMMHMRGNPRTMTKLIEYPDSDVIGGVRDELSEKVQRALRSGIKRWNIIVDPGFGFAKDLRGNCQLLASLDRLCSKGGQRNRLEGFPLLVGLSRKRFLGQLLAERVRPTCSAELEQSNYPTSNDRLTPSIVASVIAVLKGAQLVRVHDTQIMHDVLKTIDAINFHAHQR